MSVSARWQALALVAVAAAFVARAVAQVPSNEVLVGTALDRTRDSEDRCQALGALQDRGALSVPTVLAALADPDSSLGTTAAAIVRHEWRELPPELFAGLDRAPQPAALLLRELAMAPRPAAEAWARRWVLRDGVPSDLRCLGLSASGQAMTAADGDLLLASALGEEVDDGYHIAAGLLPAAIADGLLGKLHAQLAQQKVAISRVLPILDRLSPKGLERLLGLVVTLPTEVGEELCLHLVQHEVPAYAVRAAAALDGKIPLEPLWLLRAGPLLQREPKRCERLLAVLVESAAAPALKARAFDALLDAAALGNRLVDDRLLDFALHPGPERLGRARRLLDALVADLPEARLVAWLDLDLELAGLVVRALVRRPGLGERLEQRLGALLGAGVVEGEFLEAAAQAVLQHGSEASVDRVWPALRGSPRFLEFVEAIARRKAPFVHELLLEELAAADEGAVSREQREQQLDAVRLALCALGDRRQLALLVAHAKTSEPMFVRRCGYHARPLDEPLALQLLDSAATVDDDLAAELIAWAASCSSQAVTARLVELWQADPVSERQEVALRAVVGGPNRQRLQQELRAAVATGPLSERHEQLAFEIVAALPAPLAADDAMFLAELAILQPLADPLGEAARAQRWPDGRFGFPLVAAIAQRLRGTEPAAVAAAFAAAAAVAMAHPQRQAVSRQRLLVLWRSLEADRSLQTAVAQATATLLLSVTQPSGLGEGPAHWFLIVVATDRADHRAAAAHARAAGAALLRLPSERRTARLFLGERDPAAGDDPWAALAALPFLAEARAAFAAGDRAAAFTACGSAAEFVGRDLATATLIENLSKETAR